MSLLTNLKPKRGSVKKEKRVGRGDSSGWGGTAGHGHKGQKARSGAPIGRGFEGGQTPLARRLPKFGFTNNKFKLDYEVLNLDQLDKLEGEVTPQSLYKMGWIKKASHLKILGNGQITKPLNVKAHKFSASAKKMIEDAGGKVEVIS